MEISYLCFFAGWKHRRISPGNKTKQKEVFVPFLSSSEYFSQREPLRFYFLMLNYTKNQSIMYENYSCSFFLIPMCSWKVLLNIVESLFRLLRSKMLRFGFLCTLCNALRCWPYETLKFYSWEFSLSEKKCRKSLIKLWSWFDIPFESLNTFTIK